MLGRPGLDSADQKAAVKKIVVECKKRKHCSHCGAINGAVKKVSGHALKLVHDKYQWYHKSTAKSKKPPPGYEDFEKSFDEAKKRIFDLEKHVKKAADDLDPIRVLNLFRKVEPADCRLFGMNPNHIRPEMLITTYIPAPPVTIRPSVMQDGGTTEDDLSSKLSDIVQVSNLILSLIQQGKPINNVMESWDFLQIQVGMMINSEVPGLAQQGMSRPIRSLVGRLKGKQGRFRGNLSGKRVDYTGRTVISPDPNLGVDEVAIPEKVASNLTYPERVTDYNIKKMRQILSNGSKWPGVKQIIKKKTGATILVSYIEQDPQKLQKQIDRLEVGDVLERHLEDGDIVLFNRQPSLHKLSIMAHRVKVRKWRTFRLNECICTPYNADFDGDEMNLHVPQTEEARTEAAELMAVRHNLMTPKDGTPIIAATQDFVTTAYLISSKDRFYDRSEFSQICSSMLEAKGAYEQTSRDYNGLKPTRWDLGDIDFPDPAILKPEMLWTGKQIFNVLMRPNKQSQVLINFDAAGKQFKPDREPDPLKRRPNDLDSDDGWICVRNSEVMCGRMDKSVLGSGKKESIFYVMMRDFGPECAVTAMNRLARLSARWLSNEGFTIGIDDVYPGAKLTSQKQELIDKAYMECDEVIKQFREDRLSRDAGCSKEQTMEVRIQKILNNVRDEAGSLCFEHLGQWNTPIIMAKSGAKGSNINVSQMVAAVGQQIINSARVEDGFQDRTLPHFPKAARQPPSKGFVRNSFFSGLSPTEFIFHAMSGREGLVDTAVKTAETGYMSRRLMKSLEDLAIQYDHTVRNSSTTIVQFNFGEDGLDPVDMEGKAKPVNFERTFLHAQSSTWSNEDPGLRPFEIDERAKKLLRRFKERYDRKSLLGKALDYSDQTLEGIDQYESVRDFISQLEDFLTNKSDCLARFRLSVGLDAGMKQSTPKRKEAIKAEAIANGANVKISAKALRRFLTLALQKYHRAQVEPGHAVGAVGAQSIGEPGTQMTLKTFHFAGVAGMSITQGVPRIKEIINGSKTISTPVIKCVLDNKWDERAARAVKGRIEKTYLKDIISSLEEIWGPRTCTLAIHINKAVINNLELELTMQDIVKTLCKTRNLKLHRDDFKRWGDSLLIDTSTNFSDSTSGASKKGRRVGALKSDQIEPYMRIQALKRTLPEIAIKGYPEATRAVISKDEKETREVLVKNARGKGSTEKRVEANQLLVEGYGLRFCLNTPGIAPYQTTTNNITEVHSVLGIEAARKTIINELHAVMGEQMEIDPRHMQLLADTMTFKGDILGITRFGMTKMRDSVLQLASFEKTADHLFDAAVRGETDRVEGVSESIIMGQSMAVGTGGIKVVSKASVGAEDLGGGSSLFDEWCDRRDLGDHVDGDEMDLSR